MKDNFFDPKSLALDDDNEEEEGLSPATPGASGIALPEDDTAEHRLQNQFQDPLIDLGNINPLESSVVQGKAELLNEVVDAVRELTTPFAGDEATAADLHLNATLASIDSVSAPVVPQVSVAPQNTNALFQMARDICQMIAVPYSYQDLTQELVRLVAWGLSANIGTLFEYDRRKNEFFFRAVVGGDAEKISSVRIPQGHGLVGEVADTGVAEIVNHPERDARLKQMISRMASMQIQNCMAAPIFIGGQLFGVIELFNQNEGREFNETDLANLVVATEMVAKVLEVRFLWAELRK